MAAYRTARRARRPVLGTHVDGKEAAQILTRLIDEGYSRGDIARALGHQWPVLHWKRGAGVTLRTTLALRVLLRRVERTGLIS